MTDNGKPFDPATANEAALLLAAARYLEAARADKHYVCAVRNAAARLLAEKEYAAATPKEIGP